MEEIVLKLMKLLLKVSIVTVSAIVIFIFLGELLVGFLDLMVLSKPFNTTIAPGSLQLGEIETAEQVGQFNPNTQTWKSQIIRSKEFPCLENIRLNNDSLISVDVDGIEFPLGSTHQRTLFDLDLLPEEGDIVTLRYEHSCVSWWTPLNINFFIRLPKFWRNCYYTLTWKKMDGRKLIVKWHVVQDKYDRLKWGTWDPCIDYSSRTTLTSIKIYPSK